MKPIIASVYLTLLFCLNVWPQKTHFESPASVIAAENSFADSAATNGTRAAFLEFAADSAVVFSDKPENAKENWRKRVPNASLLSWRPAWADVSATGDLGYTTGSWAFSRSKTDAPVAWGEYFTIWKKQSDGSWKFMLDLGIGHDKADVVANQWKSPDSSRKDIRSKDSVDVWKGLEDSFTESLGKKGAKLTYKNLASEQIRLLREGNMPFQGKADALLQITDAEIKTKVLGGEASSDLAYAYGEYELKTLDGKVEKGFYARVWKREKKDWHIAVDVAHRIPIAKK